MRADLSLHQKIVLKVTSTGLDLLKIVWEADQYAKTAVYMIRRQKLESTIKRVRTAADELVRVYLNAECGEDGPPNYASALRELARRGGDLYYELFDGVEPALGKEQALKGKSWLAQLEGPVELIVSSDSSIHVPWGLLFAKDYNELPERSQELSDFADFWAYKYLLTVVYSGMEVRNLKKPRPWATLKLLSLINQLAFDDALETIAAEERANLDKLLDQPVGRATTWQDCLTTWGKIAADDCLLHVYAHATGQEIQLSSKETINLTDLNRWFFEPRRRGRSIIPECLMLLNGCDTAVGELSDGFLTVSAEAGCSGFVGLECPIPKQFALRFGTSLLHLLLHQGYAVGEAVDTLRRRHWPLGLLYACIAHPLFRLETGPEPLPAPYLATINFSYLYR